MADRIIQFLLSLSPIATVQAAAGLIILSFLVYIIQSELTRWQARISGLPGPRGYPIVGSLVHLRGKSHAEVYRQWAEVYGPVFQVQLGNTTVVVINSAAAAKTLLIGQSAAFNSRPEFYVLHKVVSSQAFSIGTSPWDESCKKRRRAAAGAALNRVKTEGYAPILKLEATEFIKDILENCQDGTIELDFRPYTRRFALNLSLTLNYGTRITDSKDLTGNPLLAEIIEVEAGISRYRQTSRNLSNYIPLLRYVNPALSAIGIGESNNDGAKMGARRVAYHDVLLRQLKQRIESGSDLPCIQGAVLKDPEAKLNQTELLSVSLSMMAGADSSQPSLAWAILFLAHNHDIQQKAYSAIQSAGLLDNGDLGNLNVEYVQALTKELGRYFMVLRLALPKATASAARWEQYNIPEKTVVFLNSWACGRDSEELEEAWDFRPERWLGNSDKHTHQFAFGFGGRMCVASHVSHNALYTVYLHLIAHFEIHPAEGETSESAIDPLESLNDVEGTTATPRKFKAKFIPRNKALLKDYIVDVVHTER